MVLGEGNFEPGKEHIYFFFLVFLCQNKNVPQGLSAHTKGLQIFDGLLIFTSRLAEGDKIFHEREEIL